MVPLRFFAKYFVEFPLGILGGVAFLSVIAIIVPFFENSFPRFTDPTMGFETRGTPIALRINTWKNFFDAIDKSNGALTGDPKKYLQELNDTLRIMDPNLQQANTFGTEFKLQGSKPRRKPLQTDGRLVTRARNVTDTSHDRWVAIQKMAGNASFDKQKRLADEEYFCGPPDDNYVQLVVKSDGNRDLFNAETLAKICRIESEFAREQLYDEFCMRSEDSSANCCKPWSLPNYIALLHHRPTCLALTVQDVNDTLQLIDACAQYYDDKLLDPVCKNASDCLMVPEKCRAHDAVYTILHYLTSMSFQQKTYEKAASRKLEETMVFLPLARSVGMLPFYKTIKDVHLHYDGISVVAMDLGIKDVLFDEILLEDTRLMLYAGIFVLVCIGLYTGSMFLTLMTLLAIIFSLGLAYFTYFYVYRMTFFPFMNMLAGIVIIGIGADDAFIFCKVWHAMKANDSTNNTLLDTMTSTLYHAFISMSVTSITTAMAFLASNSSYITAIRCYGIFAGTAILWNFIIMILVLPASMVLLETYTILQCKLCTYLKEKLGSQNAKFLELPISSTFTKMTGICEEFLVDVIIRGKLPLAVVFLCITILAFVVLFWYPGLNTHHTSELQLFQTNHLFEQYSLVYQHKFDFKRVVLFEGPDAPRFPLRFIWGVIPEDNGSGLNPKSTGSLVFDDTFNMSSQASQVFLEKFCKDLQRQPFFMPSAGGSYVTNCFITTFSKLMERPCYDAIHETNRFPCCNESIFPYEPAVFEQCILEEQYILHASPVEYLYPRTAGLRFSKTDPPELRALVVEYDSSYTYAASHDAVETFEHQVLSWLDLQLKQAPEGMQRAFFVTDLDYYDLQRELPPNTKITLGITVAIALVIIYLATLHVGDCLLAMASILGSIVTTMATLVLVGWQLNVLESVAMSTSIGFAVDYCLHYAVNYKLAPSTRENREAATRASLARMLGPTAMSALTTGAAGAFMIPSVILAYRQIGQFLLTVTVVSWLFATFHLGAMMAIFGPQDNFNAYHALTQFCFPRRARVPSAGTDSSTRDLAVHYQTRPASSGQSEATVSILPAQQKTSERPDARLSNQSPSNSDVTFINDGEN